VKEQGWGEFDIEITVTFANNTAAPLHFKHSLLFEPEKYEKVYSLTIKPTSTETFAMFDEDEKENEADTPKRRKTKHCPEDFTREDILSLKDKLTALQGQDILAVVDLINSFKTVEAGEANVDKTKEDMFVFQLDTLSNQEMKELWSFCDAKVK
jgi:transcription initiation factor IIF auxiliary subunit